MTSLKANFPDVLKKREVKMPLTKKGKKILASMKKQYGAKKGKEVFYASQKKGVIKGTHKGRKGDGKLGYSKLKGF